MISKAPVGFYHLRGLWSLLPLIGRSPLWSESSIAGAPPAWVCFEKRGLNLSGFYLQSSLGKIKKKKRGFWVDTETCDPRKWLVSPAVWLWTVNSVFSHLLPGTDFQLNECYWTEPDWGIIKDKEETTYNLLTAATFTEYPLGFTYSMSVVLKLYFAQNHPGFCRRLGMGPENLHL